MKGYIYCIKEKGKIIYIGSTVNFTRRKREHFTEDRKGKIQPIHRYMRSKNNSGFEIEILFEGIFQNKAQMVKLEFEYIYRYNTINQGFNLDDGKRCGHLNANSRKVICVNTGKVYGTVKEACEEYGFDISEMASHLTGKRYLNGIGKRKHGKALFFKYAEREKDNRRVTETTKKRISEAVKRKNSKKVYCENTKKVYNTLKEASKDLNVNYTSLSSHIRGSRKVNSLNYIKIYFLENV